MPRPPSIPIHWLLTTKQNHGQSQKRLVCRNYAFRYMFVSFTVKKKNNWKKQPRLHFDNSYPLRTVYFTLKKSFIIRSGFGSTFCSFLCILLKHWSNFVHFFCCRGDPASPKWTPDGHWSTPAELVSSTPCALETPPSPFLHQGRTQWLITVDRSGAGNILFHVYSFLHGLPAIYMDTCCILKIYAVL